MTAIELKTSIAADLEQKQLGTPAANQRNKPNK